MDLEAELKAHFSETAKVHIRKQQRNGTKSLTTISGLTNCDLPAILKTMRKEFATNGTIIKDDAFGEVLQLQGDQRRLAQEFLIEHGFVGDKGHIVVHGA